MAKTNGLLRKLLIQIWVPHAETLIHNFHIFLDIWLPRWTFHLILLLKSFPTIYKILKFNGQIKSYGFCILCPNSNPIIKLYFNLVEIKSPLHSRNFACVFIIWEPTSFFIFCRNNPLRIWNNAFLHPSFIILRVTSCLEEYLYILISFSSSWEINHFIFSSSWTTLVAQ